MSTAYFDEAGRILLLAALPGMSEPLGAAFRVGGLDTTDANAIYYDVASGEVRSKGEFALTTSRNLVEGLPAGTRAMFGEHDLIVDDGCVEFDADIEGRTVVHLSHLQYRDAMIEVPTGP